MTQAKAFECWFTAKPRSVALPKNTRHPRTQPSYKSQKAPAGVPCCAVGLPTRFLELTMLQAPSCLDAKSSLSHQVHCASRSRKLGREPVTPIGRTRGCSKLTEPKGHPASLSRHPSVALAVPCPCLSTTSSRAFVARLLLIVGRTCCALWPIPVCCLSTVLLETSTFICRRSIYIQNHAKLTLFSKNKVILVGDAPVIEEHSISSDLWMQELGIKDRDQRLTSESSEKTKHS